MLVFLNIISLFLEILYYSMFMKYARKEGTFAKYIIGFSFVTLIGLLIGTTTLPSYMLLMLLIIFSLKYIVKIKVCLYDLFIISIMIFLGIIIQMPCYLILTRLISNLYICVFIYQIIKLMFILAIRNSLNKFYIKMKSIWDKNNFYIRYIFSILMFTYLIFSCIFIIIFLL